MIHPVSLAVPLSRAAQIAIQAKLHGEPNIIVAEYDARKGSPLRVVGTHYRASRAGFCPRQSVGDSTHARLSVQGQQDDGRSPNLGVVRQRRGKHPRWIVCCSLSASVVAIVASRAGDTKIGARDEGAGARTSSKSDGPVKPEGLTGPSLC